MPANISTWIANARNAETQFFAVVARALEQFNNNNHSDLAKLLCICNGKKTNKGIKVIEGERLKFAPHLKRILDHSIEGEVSFKYDPELKLGVKFTKGENAGFSTARIEALRVLGQATVQSAAYKEAFPPIKRETKDKKKPAEIAAARSKGKTRSEITALAKQAEAKAKEFAALALAYKEQAKSAPTKKA